jgi:hypothetical protein
MPPVRQVDARCPTPGIPRVKRARPVRNQYRGFARRYANLAHMNLLEVGFGPTPAVPPGTR